MNKLLSIIIPSCNMEKYLAQCLESLIIPSIDDVEILVINDGSKDRTSEIGHEYEDKYPASIRVIDKPNGHYGSCINRGLAEATGKYIRVLDADDSFDTDNFQDFVVWLAKEDADLIISDYCIVNEDGDVTEERKFIDLSIDGAINFKQSLPILTQQIMAMHGVTYKRDLLIQIGYHQTEGVSYTDQEWIFAPMFNVNTVAQYPEVIYKYLVGRSGQSVDKSVISRAMALQLSLLSKRLDDYTSVRDVLSAEKKEYAFNRMRYSLANTFRCILFEKSTAGFEDKLLEIDKKICIIFPELYEDLNKEPLSSIFPFKFISYWRNRIRTGKKAHIISIIRSLRNGS